MPRAGDVILADVQFADGRGSKLRPAVVLFEELGNVVIAGITSNTAMKGIPLTVEEGAIKDSVIKPNYIFTVSHELIAKRLFSLSTKKRRLLHSELAARLSRLEKE